MFDSFPTDGPGLEEEGIAGLLEELIEPLIQSMPGFQVDIKRRVDEGARDCNCSKPNCPVGKAIRAEYARRNANGAGLTTAQIKTAVYEGQMQAMRDFAKEKHDKALTTRAGRFLLKVVGAAVLLIVQIMLTLLLAPILFIVSAIFWQAVGLMALRQCNIAELMGEMIRTGKDPIEFAVKRQPWPWPVRTGYKVGLMVHLMVTRLIRRVEKAWYRRPWHPISWIKDNISALGASLRARFASPAVAVQPADETTND